MRKVWPDAVVEETSLTRNISVLRKTLWGNSYDHMYIVTVPGTGYRFVAGVEEAASPGRIKVRTHSARDLSRAPTPRINKPARPAQALSCFHSEFFVRIRTQSF